MRVKQRYIDLRNRSQVFLSELRNDKKVDEKDYRSFRRDLEAKFPDMFLLLSKIENEIKLDEIKKFLDVKRQS